MTDTSEIAINRAGAKGSSVPNRSGPPEAELMREELQSVIDSTDFARAPIMKRLLSFLVGETAAGRGDQLKAYSVAVDGLGRAPDYDARADSYPRVQVGRLRRMLDSYYRATAPVVGLRLTIPSGRYKVMLEAAQPEVGEPAPVPAIPFIPERPLVFGQQIALLLVLLLAGTVLVLQIVPMRTGPPIADRERPLVDLSAVEMASRSEFGSLIRARLLDGLSRSTMYDLRAMRPTGALDPHPRLASYRLSAELTSSDRPRLFLRLSSAAPERLVWSGDISLPKTGDPGGDALDHALAPAIATLGRVNGVIATHQLQGNSGRQAIGYSCLLLYHQYRKVRTDEELENVRSCVTNSLELNPNNAGLQAAAAQLAIEKMVSTRTDPRNRSTLLLTARRHSQIAASIDPFDAWTNAARARIALLRKSCPQAINFARRAAQLQPYDPTLLADTGTYLLGCDDILAESMIRRAIALDDNPEGRFYAPLLLLAISRDNRRIAQEALTRMAPPIVGRHGDFYLISASGYAMIGDLTQAKTAWAQLETSYPAIARDPKNLIERLGYTEQLQAKVIGHLREVRLTR